MIDIPDIDKMIKPKKLKNIENNSIITNEIISNKHKFIELSHQININPETLSSYLNWFKIDEQLYYFKSYNAFEELFMEKIFNKVQIPVPQHTIVRCGNTIGLITPNFRKQGYKYQNYHEIIKTENLTESLKELSKIMTKQELQEYKTQIYKILAQDIIFGQGDHYEYNIDFEKKNKTIKLAPLFDNGEIFNNQTQTYTSFNSCIDNLEFRKEDLIPDEHTLTILEENPGLINELSYSFDYDLEEIFNELEQQHKITILKEIRKTIQTYYDQNCKIIEKTLNLLT